MNPLNNNSLYKPQNKSIINPELKQMYRMFNTNPRNVLQQNPRIQQVLNMYKGKDLKSVYLNMCQSQGIDPNVILNELRN